MTISPLSLIGVLNICPDWSITTCTVAGALWRLPSLTRNSNVRTVCVVTAGALKDGFAVDAP